MGCVVSVYFGFHECLIPVQTFEENSTLEGILADLIIPSVKRKEVALREKGLVSLGLCCLIAKASVVAVHPLL